MRPGINTLFQMLLEGKITDTHHLIPRGEGVVTRNQTKLMGTLLSIDFGTSL